MGLDVEIREIDPQPFMAIQFNSSQSELGQHFGEVLPAAFGHVMGQGAEPAGMPVAQYLHVDLDNMEVLAGVPVTEPLPESDRVKNGTLPGGRVAVTRHVGPYDTLGETWRGLESWIAENGREGNGAPWESYVTDPGSEPDPSKWVTEIYWPIK
jgi:AraC family transcriptional regulator